LGVLFTLALTGSAAAAGDRPSPLPVTAGAHNTDELSKYFAGYLDAVGEKQKVVATVTAPTLTCDSTNRGLGTYAEFADDGGFGWVGAAVYSFCYAGIPAHLAALQSATFGVFYLDGAIQDGDEIVLSTKEKDGAIEATVENVTQDWAEARTFSEPVPAEALIVQNIISLDGLIVPPLVDNTKAKKVKFGGAALGLVDPTKLVLVDVGVDPLVKPGKIKKNRNFTFKYVGD